MNMYKSHLKLLPGIALALTLSTASAHAAQWQALPEKAPEPADNPTTPEKVELGRILYMDPRFSSTGTVSCNSCHNVMLGGDDNRPVAMGVHGQMGGRSAPTVWNAAFSSAQFWDGRAASLEEQAKGPVVNPVEMGMSELKSAIDRVRAIAGYKPYFEKAFGKDAMTADNAAKAVAAFERTLITPNSPYDRYVKGEKQAMTKQQVKGMETFARVGCASCHSGAAFSGPMLSNNGKPFQMKFPTFSDSAYVSKYNLDKDMGRFEVTKSESDKHMFKVATLRNIELTAPYFHNGSVKTLDEAVKVMGKVQLNKDLSDDEVKDIVAFLHALTGEFPEQKLPRLPGTSGWAFEYTEAAK
ncbi:cytochrome c peroxidase [Halothiobacillus sp.]|uniref:cytochrome-c peroxidase n=1 Tax=Halothiobacillus sp. TaxID=1891311 RepID=UPI00260B48CF|nr:cytochrome c peroxidase [Halothiobacillus sp.]